MTADLLNTTVSLNAIVLYVLHSQLSRHTKCMAVELL